MKKRRFYTNNKKRNQKWTEEPKGHKIDFAEKYLGDGPYSDKFDSKRPASVNENKKRKAERKRKQLKSIFTVFLCIVLICVGYTIMDVRMTRHAKIIENINSVNQGDEGNMADVALDVSAYKAESVGLDASIMLSSIMKEVEGTGFTSIIFDAKREDGTIGYASKLASIDTFNAISSPSSQPNASVKQLIDNDILPIARLSCYKDNVVPRQDNTTAIMSGKSVYTDSSDNTYLNPDSETAYSYIKDIITECYGYGITVFVLNSCDLPEDISEKYNDGFDTISKRLNKDFNGKIKLLEEIDLSISPKASKNTIANEIKKAKDIKKNQILYISTKSNVSYTIEQLNKNGITRYVIED